MGDPWSTPPGVRRRGGESPLLDPVHTPSATGHRGDVAQQADLGCTALGCIHREFCSGDCRFEQVSVSSPIINGLEKFISFCKVQRAAFRERAKMNEGLGPFDSPHSVKEKISPLCGQSIDESCIDQVCEIISGCIKKCCAPCKERCNDMVVQVAKIVAESSLTKRHITDNLQSPTSSPTVLVRANEEVSEASAGSDGNKLLIHDKPPIVCLGTPCVNISLVNPPSVSKPIPVHVHPMNRRGPFARRDKIGLFPQTSLYSPKGLFDLHISDSDCDDDNQIENEHSQLFSIHGPSVAVTAPLKGTNPIVPLVPIANSHLHKIANSKASPCSTATPRGAPVLSPTAKVERTGGYELADTRANEVLCHSGQFPAHQPISSDTNNHMVHENVASTIMNSNYRKRGQLDSVPLGEAKENCNQLEDPLVIPGASRHILPEPAAFLKHDLNSNAPVTETTANGSNKSRSADLLDQIYNRRHVFNQEPHASITSTMDDPNASNTFKPNVSTIQKGSEPDVKYVGENWIEAQKQNVRFPLSVVHLRFYYILTGLGHSQWKDHVAVRFSKTTTVTWESFSQSIEPEGHCDNFFIAGFCRNFFEDCHPRKSKKHFFYPKVGHSLMAYNSQFDIDCVRNSFLGANSALKLHLADKLYFPICHLNHWFLFIVDLKSRCFIILDSYFNEGDFYQQGVRKQLLKVFKVVWLLYVENKINLDGFRTVYPPLPKQANFHDCGIFTLKFMELWDHDVDLRETFSQADIPKIRILLANSLFFFRQEF